MLDQGCSGPLQRGRLKQQVQIRAAAFGVLLAPPPWGGIKTSSTEAFGISLHVDRQMCLTCFVWQASSAIQACHNMQSSLACVAALQPFCTTLVILLQLPPDAFSRRALEDRHEMPSPLAF